MCAVVVVAAAVVVVVLVVLMCVLLVDVDAVKSSVLVGAVVVAIVVVVAALIRRVTVRGCNIGGGVLVLCRLRRRRIDLGASAWLGRLVVGGLREAWNTITGTK